MLIKKNSNLVKPKKRKEEKKKSKTKEIAHNLYHTKKKNQQAHT